MTLERLDSAGYLTNWAARLLARAIDRRLKPLGLSSGYLPVFFALSRTQSLTQKELALAASIEQPTMAATLTRMERDGLITRSPDPKDRRASRVALSPKARALVPGVMEATQEVNTRALGNMTPEEAETFKKMLRQVIEALDEN